MLEALGILDSVVQITQEVKYKETFKFLNEDISRYVSCFSWIDGYPFLQSNYNDAEKDIKIHQRYWQN